MISIRPAISKIALLIAGSTVKFNCEANRAARIIRNGSSLKESSGVPGVRNCFRAKSPTPSNKSMKVGGSVVNSSAMAFTVKSRRAKSASMASPKATSGFLLLGS